MHSMTRSIECNPMEERIVGGEDGAREPISRRCGNGQSRGTLLSATPTLARGMELEMGPNPPSALPDRHGQPTNQDLRDAR